MATKKNTMKINFKFITNYCISEILNIFVKRQNNYWLFSSSFAKKFNYNSKYLFLYILENNPEITAKFVINDDELRAQLAEKYGDYFIETKSINGIIEALKASTWVISSGFPILMLFSSFKRTVINVWHGVPLKNIGLCENNISSIKKAYIRIYHARNNTLFSSPSSKLTDIFSKSLGIKKEKIQILGQPRNDMLFKNIDFGKWLKQNQISFPEYEKIIFYAPTFREGKEIKLFPFPDFDQVELDKWLKDNQYIIIIRLHQSDKTDISTYLGSKRIFLFNEKVIDDIMEILSCFDLLITDYSSIYIDYLLMNKPVVFLPYDYNEYISDRGFLFDYNKFTPGPKPTNFIEFKSEVTQLLQDKTYFFSERNKTNNFFNEVGDGSCKRIVDFVSK